MNNEDEDEFTDNFINSSDNKTTNLNNSVDNSNINSELESDDTKEDSLNNNIFLDNNNLVNLEKISNERITKPKLTKYEKVSIIGERTKQLIKGAKPLVKINDSSLTSHDIALLEYDNNMIPFKIKRPLPNGTYEIWKFSELQNI